MNRLGSETSPYLRQHAGNPVDWYPWGDEAFARAREEDRPVMLSVGYSSCHWCHVMAHESFEDDRTAALVNTGFVAVKVDREERPDVDAVYMDAVQAMTGRGGWPMTVFLTPDGRPFFAGTYFPPRDAHGAPGFPRVLEAIGEAWRDRRQEVESQADALVAAIARRVTLPGELVADPRDGSGPGERFPSLLAAATAELAERFDATGGGFGPAPKFPQPAQLELCLEHGRVTGDAGSLAMVDTTLAAMAAGGIYDHLGGGFARYSTDATWTVPHFEKMLYDQAGLVRIYLHAALCGDDDRWHQVVEETVTYVLRDLASPEGGLYCAEDADSEGEEGRFYVWSPAEIADAAGPGLGAVAAEWYGVTDGGNFEGRSILRRPPGAPLRRPADVEEARRLLFEARRGRVRPGLDDKILTEWNAMFCSALAEAAGATGRADWADAARRIAGFLVTHLRRPGDGRWLRSWQSGQARHLGYAGDYAWVVDCLTRVAELTGEARWLTTAAETAHAMVGLFATEGGPLFTTGSDAESLVVRPTELLDGATPSASAVAAGALLRLGALTGEDGLTATGEALLDALVPVASTHPLAAAHAIAACGLAGGGITEVVVAGDRPDLVDTVRRRFEPTAVLASGERTGSPLWEGRVDGFAYVCRHYACREPSTSPETLASRLDRELAAERVRHAGTRTHAGGGAEASS
ncbi:MAG TPA: thioredoxin domain-containing protein [Acidimicrobiales bacterium]|nr:thioredoxin domain-containing protein [Acidimicrobiales bacterium]